VLTDTSGTRTLGYSYDLLGRVGCVQDRAATISPTGACTSGATVSVKNFYDLTELGSQGSTDFPIGQLTNTASSAALKSNQLYGPYGNARYTGVRSTPPRASPASITTR